MEAQPLTLKYIWNQITYQFKNLHQQLNAQESQLDKNFSTLKRYSNQWLTTQKSYLDQRFSDQNKKFKVFKSNKGRNFRLPLNTSNTYERMFRRKWRKNYGKDLKKKQDMRSWCPITTYDLRERVQHHKQTDEWRSTNAAGTTNQRPTETGHCSKRTTSGQQPKTCQRRVQHNTTALEGLITQHISRNQDDDHSRVNKLVDLSTSLQTTVEDMNI